MSATTNIQDGAKRQGSHLSRSGRAEFGQGSASALSMKWSALHNAASAVALLAGEEARGMTPEIRNFPAVIRDVGGWQRELADQGIADLAAVMEPGLCALLAVHARGRHPHGAAQALWQEFLTARDTILALIPPGGSHGPKRIS
ncbi:MAG: hypothetical protein P8J20_16270 [Novosphingobium sp.]|nr:hypothetical protein [Novosphingobium sp.]